MSRFLDQKLSALKPYTPGEQPRDMAQLIKLNTNESPYPPSPMVLDAVSRNEVADLRLYPDMNAVSLRRALGDFYGVDPARVFVGNGSDEVLAFCFHGLCPKGAAFADITYGFYTVFADMFGVEKEIVPLKEDFTIDPKDYAATDKTIFLANPNAPTGLCLSGGAIAALCAEKPDRLVVVDEAYVDFGGESVIPLTEQFDNLLVVQTFSKSRQLAGGRLGFAVGAQSLINDLNALKFSFNPYSINRLTLLAAEAAVLDRAYFDRTRLEIVQTREMTRAALLELGFTVPDSRANFLFVKPDGLDGEAYYRALREKKILVRWFDQDRIRDFIRLTIGTPEQMTRFLEATKEILREKV